MPEHVTGFVLTPRGKPRAPGTDEPNDWSAPVKPVY